MPRKQKDIPLEFRKQTVGKSFYPGEEIEVRGTKMETTIWVGPLGGGMQRPQVTLPGPINMVRQTT
jgi:hypothetical protein